MHRPTAYAVLTASLVAGCSGQSSPASPSTPDVRQWRLSGLVRAAGVPVNGARLTIQDGPNAGRAASTDSTGRYVFEALEQSGFTLHTVLSGFDADTRGVTLTSNTLLDIALQPAVAARLNAGGSLRVTTQSDGSTC